MSEKLEITRTDGDVTILHLNGDVDGQTESLVTTAAQAVFDSGKKNLLIDLKDVKMMSSAGLRAVHTIYKMFTSNDEIQAWEKEHAGETFKSASFKLASPSSQVHYVLSISGFLQNIYIFPNLQDAIDSFK